MNDMHNYLQEHPESLRLYDAVKNFIVSLGNVEVAQSKTQASFGKDRKFAWVWLPQLWISNAPQNGVVVSFRLDKQVTHPSIKQSIQPYPGNWMHHVEIGKITDFDNNLMNWLAQAYDLASARSGK